LGRLKIEKITKSGGIIAELATDVERRSLVIPFLALASFLRFLGSWRVRVFKVECAVDGKGEIKAGMKILCSLSALTG
jgi:hypothetical protein